MQPSKPLVNSQSRYQDALESLMGELKYAQEDARIKRIDLAVAEARVHELAQLAMKLVEMVRPEERADLRHRIAAFTIRRDSRGATAVYTNVLDLLQSGPGREWSAAEAHA